LLSQATNAPFVQRKLVGANGYEAIIPYVNDDSLLIECDESVESPPITISTSTGLALKFSTSLLRGGFLRGLKGESPVGISWPKDWEAECRNALMSGSIEIPSHVGSWIPQPIGSDLRIQTIDQLLRWCGVMDQHRISRVDYEVVKVARSASNELVRSCEARLQITLGAQYRQMLAITNGFVIERVRPCEFLGTSDLDFVDSDREWLCLTPLYEEGFVAIQCKKGVATNECYLLSGEGCPTYIGDVKRHIRESLVPFPVK
jgi:hypothetical protein